MLGVLILLSYKFLFKYTFAILFGLLFCSGAGVQAQETNAILLIQPMGPQAMVALVFAKSVAHEQVTKSLNQLAQHSGWTASKLEVNDREMPLPDASGKDRLTQQTDGAMMISGLSVREDGAVDIQPLVETMRDFGRFEIIISSKANPAYHGLYLYEDNVISARMSHAGGPYRYLFNIKDKSAAIPKLPQDQTENVVVTKGNLTVVKPKPLVWEMLPVILVATLSGLIAFYVIRYIYRPKPNRHLRPADRR